MILNFFKAEKTETCFRFQLDKLIKKRAAEGWVLISLKDHENIFLPSFLRKQEVLFKEIAVLDYNHICEAVLSSTPERSQLLQIAVYMHQMHSYYTALQHQYLNEIYTEKQAEIVAHFQLKHIL